MIARVLGLLVMVAAIVGCSESAAAPSVAGTAPSPTVTASAPALPEHEGFIGIVTPRQSIDIVAREQGVLERFDVELGQTVEVGIRLAQVSAPQLESELAMAKAALRAQRGAAARSSAAAREAARQARAERQLADRGYIAADAATAAAASRRQASAAVAEAAGQRDYEAARVTQLETRLADTTLRAPFTGRVAARYIDAGTAVTPTTKVLRLVTDGALAVRFAVAAQQSHRLQPGEEIWLCRDQGGSGTGVVRHAAPEIDAASGMVFYEGTVGAIDAPLPGERIRVVPKSTGVCPGRTRN